MNYSDQQIAKLLRSMAAAYQIKKLGNIFQIRAYEGAADAVEHSTSEIKDLWAEKRLDEIPGVGEKIKEYLTELFETGMVKHFEQVMKGIPEVVFNLLDVPGIGPQIAYKLANMGVESLDDLGIRIKSGELVEKGFSSKIAEKILLGLEEVTKRDNRILLPYASEQAKRVIEYLKSSEDVIDAHPLGSLRRMVATVGDLDFSVSSRNPKSVVEYFTKMPGIARVISQGENKATVVLTSGLQLDLLIGNPGSYGALLQHLSGSKHHNIHLRTIAEKKGLSLSEYGVKRIKDGKLIETKTEEEFYKLLEMQIPSPELREDQGEIEVALKHKLPRLVELKDIKGDLHTHSNYPFEHPSHGPGINPIHSIVKKAVSLDYQFIGVSDHPPGYGSVSQSSIIQAIAKRTKVIQSLNKDTKSIRVLNGLEIDILPDGALNVPDEALAALDYCIASIHSGHRGSKDVITRRLLAALANPHVDAISHPTNRLLKERESSQADWEEIFKFCAKNNKMLEINAYPNRLDLRDDLVRQALKYGVKFIIDTDAHEVDQMDNMLYGVSVARRGWATTENIVNSWDWKNFAKWFNIK